MMSLSGVALVTLVCHVGVSRSRFIDLSHEHNQAVFMTVSEHPHFNRSIVLKARLPIFHNIYVESGWYSSSEHGGTHIDAPAHFYEGYMTINEIPIEYTVLDGVMIDCAAEANKDRDYGVPIQKVLDWEKQHGRIKDESAVLFNFNWSRRYGDEADYKGTNNFQDYGSYHYPFIAKETAAWLLENRKPRMIGGDVLMPDPFSENGEVGYLPIHQTYLKENRLLIENLKDAWQLPPRGFRLHATPVKFKNSTGTQIRAFAMTFDNEGNSGHVVLPSVLSLVSALMLLVTSHLTMNQ